jgi:hypothetical protein
MTGVVKNVVFNQLKYLQYEDISYFRYKQLLLMLLITVIHVLFFKYINYFKKSFKRGLCMLRQYKQILFHIFFGVTVNKNTIY